MSMNCFSSIYKFYIKTTNTCNLNCSHCYTGGMQKQRVQFDSKAVADFIEKLVDINKISKIDYSFHGGEPMLVPTDEMNQFVMRTKVLSPDSTYAIQTNLAYTLTGEKLHFLKCMDYVGTSWDYKIRFKDDKKIEELWERNLKELNNSGVDTHVTISVTKDLIRDIKPIDIINKVAALGTKNILFERLTSTGNASDNVHLFPNSAEQDRFFADMWESSLKHETYKYIHNMFFEPTAGSILRNGVIVDGQRRCRGCESQVLTFNSDGTIGGCPDGAKTNSFGTIHDDPRDVLHSKARSRTIAKENIIDISCYKCDLFDVCKGDCYKQVHDEHGCMAPRTVMRSMLSLDKSILEKFAEP